MKKLLLLRAGLLALLPLAALAQSVGIGTSTPAAAAALDIQATTKGLLIPRLTAGQRAGIVAPPPGLLVYQTDGTAGGGPGTGFWYFGGNPAAWVFLNPAGGGADNLGNHLATQPLNLQANALTGTGASIGTTVGVGVRADGGLNIGQNTYANNVMLGYQAGAANTTGSFNYFSGYQSGLANTTGDDNVFTGNQSGAANTTGSLNQFEGLQSGISNTTGSGNSFFGPFSGLNNRTGNGNTAVGNTAGPASEGLINTTALGSLAKVNVSNKIRLGNNAVTVIEGQVGFSNPSDARFKYRVRADVPGLAFLTRLVPVTYRFDGAKLARFQRTGALPAGHTPDPRAPVRSGFLAQDVARAARAVGYAFDGLHAPANARDHYSLAYAQFVVPLVRAVQELNQQVRALQTQNAAQNAALQAHLTRATADHAALLAVQAQLTRLLGETPVARAAGR